MFCNTFNDITEARQSPNRFDDPPQLNATIPKLSDLNVQSRSWESIQLPADVLLLTVEDHEFLSCYFYLEDPFKSYHKGLGHVYFGEIGDGQKKLKISLVRCSRGSTQVGASQNAVRNAVEVLKPKVVFSVGCCGGLDRKQANLGDVVISAKLSTYAEKKIIGDRHQWCGHISNVSKNVGDLIKSAADGWKAPLNDQETHEVTVHREAEILTGPHLVDCPRESEELLKQFPGAIAIEPEGQGKGQERVRTVSCPKPFEPRP